MSVGAGSIKRAAKAAEGSTEAKTAKSSAGVKAVKSAESGAEAKAAKSSAETKAGKTAKGSTETKAVKKEAVQKPAAKKNTTAYVAYGIGQELPVHLM